MEKQTNIPELRFLDFNEEWRRKKLGAIAELTSSKRVYLSDYTKSGIPFYRGKEISEIKEGIEPSDILFISEDSYHRFKENYGVPQENDILITAVGTLGNVLRINNSKPFYFKDGNLIWLRKIKEDSKYLEIILSVNHKTIEKSSIGSTQRALTMVELRKLYFPFPTLTEQQKIASFFTANDKKISQLKQKKTLLEQYKKGVMQKIFSQEIRFRDDNGQEFPKWEKMKFNQLYSFRVTNSFSRDNLNYEAGEVKNIHYGDIHTQFPTLLDITQEKVPYINSDISIKKISDNNYCRTNDLVFADASEDVQDVGKCIELINLNDEKVLAGLHTILARPAMEKVASGFGGYLMMSIDVRKQIMKISQGSKVTSISSTRLGEIELNIPNTKEQTKIANFLTAIDNKICHTQSQIEKAELWKKGLLQKMFV